MAEADKDQICKTTILQLPELVFHEIFKYLDYKTLYFSLRDVCWKMRQHVDCHIDMKGIFMTTGENQSPSKIIFVYKKAGSEIEGSYEYGPGCPSPISHVVKLTESKQKEEKGIFCDHKVSFFTHNSRCLTFDYKYLQWSSIQQDIPLCSIAFNHNNLLTWNPESVEFYTTTTMDPVATDGYNQSSMNLFAQHLNCNSIEDGFFTFHSRCVYLIDLPLELKNLRYFTMIRCTPQEVLFIGGSFIGPYQLFGREVTHNYKIWHGVLSNNGCNMIWSPSNMTGRNRGVWGLQLHEPMCIKLKDYIYIFVGFQRLSFYKWDSLYPKMGKMSVDRYDWKQQIYDRREFGVPYAFMQANELKSVSSSDETFAIIISRQWENRINSLPCDPFVEERVWIFNPYIDPRFKELFSPSTTSNLDRPLDYEKLLRLR